MHTSKKQMLATLVKTNRTKMHYTQQDLAAVSNISLRSIQRIEKGEVMPRPHTLKMLANSLDFSLDLLNQDQPLDSQEKQVYRVREVFMVIFISLTTLLTSIAFVAQSAVFPETDFELLVYALGTLVVLFLILNVKWKLQGFTSKPKISS